MKWNSKTLEDAIISQKFKHGIIRRLVRQVEYSVTDQEWSHLKNVFLKQHKKCQDKKGRKEMKSDMMMSVLAQDMRRMKQE